MSSPEYRARILTAMRDVLAPVGFRKAGPTSRRTVNDVVQLVNLQSSTSSTAGCLIVTVNLAVFSTTLSTLLGATDLKPTVWDGHWRERIGHLSPAREDRWWRVEKPEEVDQAAGEIAALLSDVALPKLEQLGSTDALRTLWVAGEGTGLTAFQRRQYLNLLGPAAAEGPPIT